MSALIRSLAVAGARKSDGTPVSSGKVFLYVPGTTTITAGYKDDFLSEAWVTVSGGIPLDAGGRVKIWVNDPVDVVVTDSSGTTVDTMLGFNKTRAEQIEVENENYTGALTDDATGEVTQGLGGRIDLDTILTRKAESDGGPDGKYLESTGATARKYRDVVREIHITPQDFSAAGNGIRDDTQSIINAITELVRLGGGTLYFPPGTYRKTAQIQVGTSLANASGISFSGAGSQATFIKEEGAGNNGFFVYASAFRLKGMTITHLTSSTASAIRIENGSGVQVDDVVTDGTYRYAILANGSTLVRVRDSKLQAVNADTLARAFAGSVTSHVLLQGCDLQGGSTGTAVEVLYSGSNWLIEGNKFSNSAAGILYTDDPITPGTNVPTGINIVNNPTLGSLATPIVVVGTATHDGLFASGPVGSSRQSGNSIEGATANIASGATYTPRPYSSGVFLRARGTSTGVAYVVAAPDYTPTIRGWTFTLLCVNAAGGAVTGWTFNAIYQTNGAVNTDLHTTSLTFEYDLDAVKWREISRTDTVT